MLKKWIERYSRFNRKKFKRNVLSVSSYAQEFKVGHTLDEMDIEVIQVLANFAKDYAEQI